MCMVKFLCLRKPKDDGVNPLQNDVSRINKIASVKGEKEAISARTVIG